MPVNKHYNLAVAPSRGASGRILTMDAAAVSSGLAFLESELEKLDPMLREPLTSTTYPRDIVITSGGGWIEAESAFNVDYAVYGQGPDWQKKAFHSIINEVFFFRRNKIL